MRADEAAAWMLQKLQEDGFLYQETAAMEFAELGDPELAYYDDNGSLCVGRSVLTEFRKITGDYVYERQGKFWRQRLETDAEGRQQ